MTVENLTELEKKIQDRIQNAEGANDAVTRIRDRDNFVEELQKQDFVFEEHQVSSRKLPGIKMGIISITDKESRNSKLELVVSGSLLEESVRRKPTDINKLLEDLVNYGYAELTEAFYINTFSKLAKVAIRMAKMDSSFPMKEHTLIGFHNNNFYGVNECVNTDETLCSHYNGPLNVKIQGSVSGYKAAMIEACKKAKVAIALAAGFSGIIKEYFWPGDQERKVVISFYGIPGQGKTSLLQSGCTTMGNEVISYNNTKSYIEELSKSFGLMPQAIDDLRAIHGFDIEDPSSVRDLIFSLANGESKGRLQGAKGKAMKKTISNGAVLLSSTKALLPLSAEDEGQSFRILEIPVQRSDVAEDKAELEMQISNLQANSGALMSEFASAILKNETNGTIDVPSEYDRIHARLSKKMPDNRLANRPTMILLTALLMNKLVGTQFPIISMEDVLVSCACIAYNYSQGVGKPKMDPLTAPDRLRNYVERNIGYFHQGRFDNDEDRKNYIGMFLDLGAGNVELRIPAKDEFVMQMILNDIDGSEILKVINGEEDIAAIDDGKEILQDFRNNGILKTGGRKGLKGRLIIQKNCDSEEVYCLDIKGIAIRKKV